METILNEQLILEDLMDDIGSVAKKKTDTSKLVSDDDIPDSYADERLEERPFDLAHWKYIFEIMTINIKEQSSAERLRTYYNGISWRFREFFDGYSLIKAHSALRIRTGNERVWNLPDEIDELYKYPKNRKWGEGTDYLYIEFGVDIDFKSAKQLFRFMAMLQRSTWGSAWYVKVYNKDFENHWDKDHNQTINYYWFDRMHPLYAMVTHGKLFDNYLQNDEEELFRKFVTFAQNVLGQRRGIVPYLHKVMNYDQSDMYISGLLREYLTDGRSRKVTLTKMMEQRITSNPIDADFVRTNDYPGYYFSSPTSMRVNEKAYTYDIKCPYVTGEFADQVAERQIYVKDYTLRMAGRGIIMFAAYIGTFYKSDGPLDGTDNQENDCVVWFNGYIEKHMFWDALAGLFGTHFDDADIDRVVWKTFKMHYEPQK